MRNGKLRDKPWFQASVLFLFFMLAYWVPLKSMAATWWSSDDYSYALLIPLVSAYMLWDKRAVMRTISLKEDWRVFPLLLFFIILSLYGILGSSGNISMPAIPVLIILFTAFCFGIDTIKKLRAPLLFLLFMAPVPPIIERYVGIYLKAISTRMGGFIMQVFDIPVYISGNVLDLGVTQLQVADACSGMRYMFALLALGFIYAYFFERVTWKRVFAFLSTIPVGVCMNGLRIGITGILTDKYGVKTAQGFYHSFSGWAFFIAAFLCIFAVGSLLKLLPPKSPPEREETDVSVASVTKATNTLAVLVSILLMAVVGFFTLSTDEMPAIKIRDGLQSFPLSLPGWHGHFELIEAEIVRESGAEEAFSGIYQDNRNKTVFLYLGYRSSAFLSNENFFHSPNVCLPSAGWTILEDKTYVIRDVHGFGSLPVDRLIMDNAGRKMLVYFWFQTKNKATQYKDVNRFHLAMHAIKRDNTHDFLIRTMTPMEPDETFEKAQARMDGFVRQMMSVLQKFLKEKQYNDK